MNDLITYTYDILLYCIAPIPYQMVIYFVLLAVYHFIPDRVRSVISKTWYKFNKILFNRFIALCKSDLLALLNINPVANIMMMYLAKIVLELEQGYESRMRKEYDDNHFDYTSIGDYTIIKYYSRCIFTKCIDINKDCNLYKGYLVTITDKKGDQYNITPLGDFPDDFPDNRYELHKLVGDEYILVGEYDDPLQISEYVRQESGINEDLDTS